MSHTGAVPVDAELRVRLADAGVVHMGVLGLDYCPDYVVYGVGHSDGRFWRTVELNFTRGRLLGLEHDPEHGEHAVDEPISSAERTRGWVAIPHCYQAARPGTE